MSEQLAISARPAGRQTGTALYVAVVAFLTYASVYAFRKPFTVATFEGISFLGIPYQTLLIISQVIGYMGSKFAGIKLIAELKQSGRWKTAMILIGAAWISLLFFALVPAPFGMIFLLINGFSLGFMWGIVFSYVEGRRTTDFIGSTMAVSFIFAGGFTRSVAKWLMLEWSVSEKWMPFMTGLVFIVPIMLLFLMLEKIPAPTSEDVRERTARVPLDKSGRKQLLRRFGGGLIVITITYSFLTVMRDVRDNYMANMWNEIGYGNDAGIFARSESSISISVLALMALLVLVRRNLTAFRLIHVVIAAGFLLAGVSSCLFVNGRLNGALWMQLTGLGLYMAYIPFNCIFFERLIATFKIAGNVGFLIYLADAYGYLGSVSVMLGKSFLDLKLNWSGFFSHGVILLSVIGIAGTVASLYYFNNKFKQQNL
ncbi:DUF5690 family protein [Pseudoflavitalea sp. G-6-1-2]|uniref:DUF5690 family protein n=1 Tax=Pseudoflavitalea sp. G-6-1-2 TaxID=2728841 RepID=UPI0019809052|nr:DUF5690 family protein [Pseudoflavitalea sp. G-6-1-2]